MEGKASSMMSRQKYTKLRQPLLPSPWVEPLYVTFEECQANNKMQVILIIN